MKTILTIDDIYKNKVHALKLPVDIMSQGFIQFKSDSTILLIHENTIRKKTLLTTQVKI